MVTKYFVVHKKTNLFADASGAFKPYKHVHSEALGFNTKAEAEAFIASKNIQDAEVESSKFAKGHFEKRRPMPLF